MAVVFFIYGLAFFLLGFAIMLYPRKSSEFRLADHLYLIAGFGIIHGINEWLDLFILISNSSDTTTLKVIRAATLPLSFLCLIHFGAKTIPLANKKLAYFKFLAPLFFVLWLAVFLFDGHNLLMWDIWSRYLLCAPGAFLTAWGLILQLPEFQKTKFKRAITNLKIAAVAFLCYSVLAGLIVPKADFFPASFLNYDLFKDHLGIPVQVFRSICALTMAYGIIRVLSIFYWETRNRIRQSELKFRTVATEAPVIIFITDNKAAITFIEGKGLELLNLTPNILIGQTIAQAFPDTPHISENCTRALSGEESVSTEKINDHFFEICLSPLKDRKDETTGVIGVAVDVTQQTNTQRELENYRDEMAQTRQMATLGTMSETMARQLGEPLAVTRLFLQRLTAESESTNLSDAPTKKIRDALNETNNAIEIIDKFYEAAHITPSPVAEPIDLHQTAKKIISVFNEKARHSGLELTTHGIDIVPCMRLPSRQLEQIFFILIQNAIDNAEQGKKNKLLISCRIESRTIELRFMNNCAHIPPEKLESVFEPFALIRNNAKDSGLGLAIVKRIIEAYHGMITVESKKDHGTTFQITLPVEHVY
jgi:PAS domain S-box-containing protein